MAKFMVLTVADRGDDPTNTLPIAVEAEDAASALYQFESKYFFETRYQLPVGDSLFIIPLAAVRRIEVRPAESSQS